MDYYINLTHASPPFLPIKGSFLYYCYRKLPQHKQTQLMVVENLQHQLITTCELYREQAVAVKKLEWWIDEVRRAFNGKPNHPITKAMIGIIKEYNISEEPLIKTILSKVKVITGERVSNTQELEAFIQKQYTYFERLKGYILYNNINLDPSILRWLEDSAEIMETVRYIYLLLWHKNHQLYLLPDIDASTEGEMQKEVLGGLCQKLLITAQKLSQNMTSTALKPMLNRLKLHIKILKAMKKNGFNVELNRVELSPLQMLFVTR